MAAMVIGFGVLAATAGAQTAGPAPAAPTSTTVAAPTGPTAAPSPPPGVPGDRPLRLAVRQVEPFDIRRGDRWTGFSIDVWRAMAAELGTRTDFVEVGTVKEQLAAVSDGRADAAIGAISITAEREVRFDFSKPFLDSGIQIMTRARAEEPGWLGLFTPVFSRVFLEVLLLVGVLLIIAGHAIWLVERRRNPDFPKGYVHGVEAGLWWAVVTLSTVGYGDKTAQTKSGRAVSVIWMLLGILLVAQITATFASEATINRLNGDIETLSDLYDRKVATVRDTSPAAFARRQGLPVQLVGDVTEAEQLLLDEKVDAVLYDAPILRYFTQTRGAGRAEMVGPLYDPQGYGVAVPEDSPLSESLDRALLQITEDDTLGALKRRWFGD